MILNDKYSFGFISIFLHWSIAIAIFSLFGIGLYMVELTYYDALYKTLPHWHKSIGLVVLALSLFRLFWRLSNPLPMPINGNNLINTLVKSIHFLMYLILFGVLFSGYFISTAKGRPISIFNWLDIPAMGASIPNQEDIAGSFHLYLAIILIALSLLHIVGALKHHIIDKDRTLLRMLKTNSKSIQ